MSKTKTNTANDDGNLSDAEKLKLLEKAEEVLENTKVESPPPK